MTARLAHLDRSTLIRARLRLGLEVSALLALPLLVLVLSAGAGPVALGAAVALLGLSGLRLRTLLMDYPDALARVYLQVSGLGSRADDKSFRRPWRDALASL